MHTHKAKSKIPKATYLIGEPPCKRELIVEAIVGGVGCSTELPMLRLHQSLWELIGVAADHNTRSLWSQSSATATTSEPTAGSSSSDATLIGDERCASAAKSALAEGDAGIRTIGRHDAGRPAALGSSESRGSEPPEVLGALSVVAERQE